MMQYLISSSRLDVLLSLCVSLHPIILFHLEQPEGYKNRGDLESEMGIRKACRFPKAILGPCSGTEDQYFGFSDGRPCLIVKLNRIVYFRPKVGLLDFRYVPYILF